MLATGEDVATGEDYPRQCRLKGHKDNILDDPMPQLFFKAPWTEVKKFFQTETKKIALELLGLT